MSATTQGQYLVIRNPATGEMMGQVEKAGAAEVSALFLNAREAQGPWEQLGAEERCQRLTDLLTDLAEESGRVGEIMSREMGKPVASAVGETRGTAVYYLEQGLKAILAAQRPEMRREDQTVTTTLRVPHGVVACITAWNFPVSLPMGAILPALLMGNTVLFKPSEHAVLTGQAMVEIASRHLPEGVLQLVAGDGEQGDLLGKADIDMLTFVGSQVAAKKIMTHQGPALNPVIMEMGSKDSMLVLQDADLQAAARHAVMGSLRNSGQVCVSVERIFVEESVYESFLTMVRQEMQNWTPGNPLSEDTKMGPIVSSKQRDRIYRQLEEARQGGAKVEGGDVIANPEPSDSSLNGFFMTPALVLDAVDTMRVLNEESFGPIVCVQKVPSAEAAVANANRLGGALGASVWGQDVKHAESIAAQLKAGMIGVNRGIGPVAGSPFVGNGRSTLGYTGGIEGHRQFAQIRQITKSLNS